MRTVAERPVARRLAAAAFSAGFATACAHNLKFPKVALPDGAIGEEYSAKLDLGRCDSRISSAAVDHGKMPPGVGLSYSRATEAHNLVLLQGVPREAGTYKFTLGAACKGMEDSEVVGRYVLNVTKGQGVVGMHFMDENPPAGTVGEPYDEKIPIGKCPGAFEDVDVAKGKLPPGVRAQPASDDAGDVVALTGTPKKAGTYNFTLLAACGGAAHTLEPDAQLTHSYRLIIAPQKSASRH